MTTTTETIADGFAHELSLRFINTKLEGSDEAVASFKKRVRAEWVQYIRTSCIYSKADLSRLLKVFVSKHTQERTPSRYMSLYVASTEPCDILKDLKG